MKARCGLEDCDCEYTISKLVAALRTIAGNCEVYQNMDTNMSAGDFLDLIEQDANNAIQEAGVRTA